MTVPEFVNRGYHWWSAGKGDPTMCVLCGAAFTLEVAQIPCAKAGQGMPMAERGGYREDAGDDA